VFAGTGVISAITQNEIYNQHLLRISVRRALPLHTMDYN
jgi:hypothetical protein